MKPVKVAVNIAEYQGRKDFPGLPIAEEIEVQEFENVAELRAAGAFPSDADVLDMVNAGRRASARAKRTTELTKGFKAEYEKTDEFKVKGFVKHAELAKMPLGELETIIGRLYPNYSGDALVGYKY